MTLSNSTERRVGYIISIIFRTGRLHHTFESILDEENAGEPVVVHLTAFAGLQQWKPALSSSFVCHIPRSEDQNSPEAGRECEDEAVCYEL